MRTEDLNGFEAFDFSDGAWDRGVKAGAGVKSIIESGGDAAVKKERKPPRRRTTECVELSEKYQYRRAFGEVQLLESMQYTPLLPGTVWNFITWGDVDSLSLLKICMNGRKLDYLLISTWVISAEDILQVEEWKDAGRLDKIDIYVGEIFPGSYQKEWELLQRFYARNKDMGRCVAFRNHSKLYAGANYAKEFYFGIQCSANVNTNPRTEQASITIDEGLYKFYREYFDEIGK